MGFDSLGYYYFLFLIVYLLRAWSPSVSLLLGASLAFYATFDWRHLALLLGLSVISYFGGAALAGRRSRALLASLLCLVFLPLAFCKLGELAGLRFASPLGISFFTFHCASYLIDCGRGTARPEVSARRFFLYVSFFPQLIAGPITRASEVLPQLPGLKPAEGAAARRAIARIYLGLLKKLAVANVAWLFAGSVFAHPASYRGIAVLAAVIAARYYVFADFSGYSDIAIGSASLLGITLPENFRRPFAAPSIAEYWRRWHMTLSSWIRDYLLFPLTVSPLGRLGPYPLVIFTFLCLGAWHGLSWNFFLYGLWHGVFLVLHDATRAARLQAWARLGLDSALAANWIFPWITFLCLVCPPTVFFLTRSPADALAVASALANGGGKMSVGMISDFHLASSLLTVGALEAGAWFGERMDVYSRFARLPRALRWLAVGLALVWLGLAGEFTVDSSFLYFRF